MHARTVRLSLDPVHRTYRPTTSLRVKYEPARRHLGSRTHGMGVTVTDKGVEDVSIMRAPVPGEPVVYGLG